MGLWTLMAAVVGCMIGGGVFNLPKDMAVAGSGAVLVAWLITGVGMIALALVFQNLSLRKEELSGGIYSYARAGFGPFIGFSSAWGYWISAILGNVSFVVLLLSTLNWFVPIFGETKGFAWLMAGSVFVWIYHLLILRGVREAAVVGLITTVAKLLPIFVFVVFLAFSFKRDIFFSDFWGTGGSFDWSAVLSQVKDVMLVTLWTFVGIEGAVVLSGRAKRVRDVGKATVFGLLGTLLVYMLISVLSMGMLSREELAALDEPSMAFVLEHAVGPWGAALINLGLITSIAGAMLSWTLLAIEIPYVAAKDGMFPRTFTRENRRGTPVVSLWWTNGITQLFVLIVFFQESTYQFVYSMASVAILLPYLLASLYQLKLVRTGETYSDGESRGKDLLIGMVATLYAVWLLYAAGLEYVLMVAALYLAGLVLYAWVRRASGLRILTGWDWGPALIIVIFGVAAVWLMVTGELRP